MLALSDEKLAEAFAAYKEGLKKKIVKANEELKGQHRLCYTIADKFVISVINYDITIFKKSQFLHALLL